MTAQERYEALQTKVEWRPVLITAVRSMGVESLHVAQHLLDAFLQWFALIPSYNGKLQMLPEVDKMWHALILNTRLYHDVCNEYIGEYVHHDALDPLRENEAKAEYATETLRQLHKEYDHVNPALLALEDITPTKSKMTCCYFRQVACVHTEEELQQFTDHAIQSYFTQKLTCCIGCGHVNA